MNLTQKTMMLMTLAVAAFGADRKLGFQAEFPFQVGSVTMPAGAYVVEQTTSVAPVVTLRNVAEKKGAMLHFATVMPKSNIKGNGSIDFRCDSSGCAVVAINNLIEGATHVAYSQKVKNLKAHMISLNLRPVQGE